MNQHDKRNRESPDMRL